MLLVTLYFFLFSRSILLKCHQADAPCEKSLYRTGTNPREPILHDEADLDAARRDGVLDPNLPRYRGRERNEPDDRQDRHSRGRQLRYIGGAFVEGNLGLELHLVSYEHGKRHMTGTKY